MNPDINHPLAGPESAEQLVCEIERHPIGILGVYVGAGLLTLVLGIVIFVVAPRVLSGYGHGKVMLIGAGIFAAFMAIAAAFVYINHKVYWGNRWIVTTHNITQIRRISLFDKQTSQLSLTNLEDITAEQNGLLAQLLHYGVISAETAAATDKFTFNYCPEPNEYVQKILAAREQFEQSQRQYPPAAPPAAPEAQPLAAGDQPINPGQ